MDFEETETMNDCAGEARSKLTDRPVGRQRRKHESRRISIVGNRNRATTTENYKRLRLRLHCSNF
jgi:hypothetical protein